MKYISTLPITRITFSHICCEKQKQFLFNIFFQRKKSRSCLDPSSVGQNLWTQRHELLFQYKKKKTEIALVTDFNLTYRSMHTRNSSEIAENILEKRYSFFQRKQHCRQKRTYCRVFCMGPDTNISNKFSPKRYKTMLVVIFNLGN